MTDKMSAWAIVIQNLSSNNPFKMSDSTPEPQLDSTAPSPGSNSETAVSQAPVTQAPGADLATFVRQLEKSLGETMLSDRHRLRRQMRSIQEFLESGKPCDRKVARLKEQLDKSQQTYRQRAEKVPRVTYDQQLPVSGRRKEIAAAIRDSQVVVICGETGSGKSTQLPKICLEMGRGIAGLIGHTQPRRIAARSIAARVAEELSCPVGQHVGYKVRFTDATSSSTFIKLMTDGILLAESQQDRFLDQYDTIIIDEAHERSLNIDFLLGCLRQLLPKRRELKVVITSATLDAERFAEFFADSKGPAPIIEVSGRTYPVEVRYRPLEDLEEDPGADEPAWLRGVVAAVEEVAAIDTGDILLFMPTERDIHEAAKRLRRCRLTGDTPSQSTEILPLYARLSNKDQQRVFQPHQWRRIVLATNVAESSLTVPGIRYVVDPGTARISRYAPRSGVQRLPVEAVSRASADQRKGRCGRVGPGICVRLYSEEDYQGRPQYTAPEIQRTDLASVILQTMVLNLGPLEEFPFLDPPKTENVRDGYRTLFELGAIDGDYQLTELGRRLGKLPVDPRTGRIILAGEQENCLHEVLIIAAALEVQDPRERPLEKQQAADEAHTKFSHEESDFLSYLKLWDFYQKLKSDLSRNQLRKACRQNFLSYNRLREWADVHSQLVQLVEEIGLKQFPRQDDYGAIHRALLAGLLSQIGYRTDANEYTVAGGQKVVLWPGAACYAKKPKWIVAAEIVETSRRYARMVARVNPKWVEPLALHLVQRSYSDPYWVRENGSVMAFEKVNLFGLTVVPRRRVRFGPINPSLARTIFIQDALVEEDFDCRLAFFRHNQQLLEEVEELAAKARRRDLLQGERARYEFYDRRLAADVYDGPTLAKWIKAAPGADRKELYMSRADLMRDEAEEANEQRFPATVAVSDMQLPLEYVHNPGEEDDGLTVTVPEEGLAAVDEKQLGWLVPGLLEEKVAALIKTLPKPIRRNFVPAPEVARKVVGHMKFGRGSLVTVLAETLSRLSGSVVPADAFDLSRLPAHLQMNVKVVDAQGETVAAGRDVSSLRDELGIEVLPEGTPTRGRAQQTISSFTVIDDPRFSRDGITAWDFGDLPDSVPIQRGSMTINAYPALFDRGQSVSLRLVGGQEYARRETRRGLRRLFLHSSARRELKYQRDHLPDWDQLNLWAATLPDAGVISEQITELLADRALPDATLGDDQLPRTEGEFQDFVRRAKAGIGPAVQEVAPVLSPLFQEYQRSRRMLEQSPGRDPSSKWHYAFVDLLDQLSYLVAPGFLTSTPWEWLRQIPRYLRGQQVRHEKIGSSLLRDQQAWRTLQPRWHSCKERLKLHRQKGIRDAELEQFRWMLEEWRISLFAQGLGTSLPVSEKRLDKQWQKVRVE